MVPLRATPLTKVALFLQFNRRQVTLQRAVKELERSGDSFMTATAELIKTNTIRTDDDGFTSTSIWQGEAVRELCRLGAEFDDGTEQKVISSSEDESQDEYDDVVDMAESFTHTFGHAHGIHFELSDYKNPIQPSHTADWNACKFYQ